MRIIVWKKCSDNFFNEKKTGTKLLQVFVLNVSKLSKTGFKKQKRTLPIILLLLFSSINLIPQDILPFVENFRKQDYHGDNQIWDITQGSDNALYFANNCYLLRYNGTRWKKYSLPNKTIIRSVYADFDTIYTGSLAEFGFWVRECGDMKYFSLSDKSNLFLNDYKNTEIWKIFSFKNKLYFQGFDALFSLCQGVITEIKLPDLITYCYVVDNEIYVASVNNGVYKYFDDKFHPIPELEGLKGKIIHYICSYDNKIYLFTNKTGVYVYKKGLVEKWQNPVNKLLIDELILTAKFIDNHKLAIGTASNGLYIVDMQNESHININRNVGLTNNTILSICTDKENDIWLGLDNGIAHIEYNSPYRFYTDKTGFLGSVYSVAVSEQNYMLGSNHGVFVYQNGALNMVDNSQGHVWNISKLGDNYLIGHNDGTFLLSKGNLERINTITGGWKLKANIFDNSYIQANYTGLVLYTCNHDNIKWKQYEMTANPIKDFAQLSPNEIIVSYSSRGLNKIKFDSSYRVKSINNIAPKEVGANDFGVKIFVFKNEPLFYINNLWYKYDKIVDSLVKYQLFNHNFKDIDDILPINDTIFAVIKSSKLFIVKSRKDMFYWRLIPKKYYEGRIINNFTSFIKHKDSYIMNLDDGFVIIDPNIETLVQQPVIIEAYMGQSYLPINSLIDNNSTLEFDIISPYFGNKKIPLAFKIDDNKIEQLDKDRIIVNNISGGKHKLSVYLQTGKKYHELNSFSWKARYPLYLSPMMFIVYLFFVISALTLYYRWNKMRFRERLKLREEELKHQNELLQLELQNQSRLKTEEYEKKILKGQVQIKASELVGKSLALAKQTELIAKIQRVIKENDFPNNIKNQIEKIIKTSNLNKNEWKSFENNLFNSNEEFVKKLTLQHPNLTSKEIKLAIYLKMNLSSKEIAPLMKISHRGVEIQRYRLRKKMNIPTDTNLNVYMNGI